MAVGSGFNSPETQAAIAAQAEAAQKAAEGTDTKPTTEEAAAAEAAKAAETPSAEDVAAAKAAEAETKKSAESDSNMDNLNVQSQEEIDKALTDAGFSNDDLGKELADNNGKLTAATVAALKEKFDPTAVDNSVADMEKQFSEQAKPIKEEGDAARANIDTMNDYIYGELAGGDIAKGKENLEILSTWAKDKMNAGDLAAVNALLRSGDKAAVKRGLEMAVTQWKAGKEKPMMSGDSAAAAASTEVKLAPLSKDEFIQIMGTEKYETDPVYAAEIDNRRRKTLETEGAMTPEFSHLRPPI